MRLTLQYNYISDFKKFITGQYLTKGVRITVGAILPALILYQYDRLSVAIALPLGALMVSLTDSPGPIHHRRNGMMVSNLFNFLVALIIGFTRYYPWLLAVEISLLSFFLSFIGIYGNRAGSVGLIAIIVMVLNIDVHHAQERVLHDAVYMLVGGLWYTFLSLALYSLRPYKLIQQALGESIITTAAYLKAKSRLYKKGVNVEQAYQELFPLQIDIHNQHEQLREMLFKARGFTKESTGKGRILLMMFMDTVDLFEHVMTSQQNYQSLQQSFGQSGILEKFRYLIVQIANELDKIGLAVQSGFPSKSDDDLDALVDETEDSFVQYRDQAMGESNLEAFISLRHILNSIKDICERIKRLRKYSSYSSEVSKEVKPVLVDAEKFVSRQEMDGKFFIENLTLTSNNFRHSLRVSICMLAGYIIAQFFPFGHSYWILLTVVTILKPAYSISKKRNIERLLGTVVGIAIGFVLLYFVRNESLLFAFMVAGMVIGYSFLQIQYLVAVAGITLYVLLSFHYLHPSDFRLLATDRIIDTAIGSGLAFLGSLFFLPKWEYQQVNEYIEKLMEANLQYFKTVAQAFYDRQADVTQYKITRKEAYVALANLSDAFQRSLSEPKREDAKPELLHQLVVSNHMLTSHIASLAIYAGTLAARYKSPDFQPAAEIIASQMETALERLQHKGTIAEAINADRSFAKIRDMVHQLRLKRVAELQAGTDKSEVRKSLSAFRTIADQFEIIQTIITDINNILKKMNL